MDLVNRIITAFRNGEECHRIELARDGSNSFYLQACLAVRNPTPIIKAWQDGQKSHEQHLAQIPKPIGRMENIFYLLGYYG